MFELRADGKAFTGWVSCDLTRSLDQFAHSFDFTCAGPHRVDRGAAVEIAFSGQELTAGYADAISTEIGRGNMSARVTGRSRTADLVDCAVVHKSGQWLNKGAREIIRDIARPFGLAPKVDPLVPHTKITRFDLETGERAFDAIDRIARAVGFLPVTTNTGDMALIRISRTAGLRTERAPVEHAIRRQVEIVDGGRFSEYHILSQSGRADPEESPRRAALERFMAKDTAVARYRPTVTHNETGARVAELEANALWARNTAAGQSLRYQIDLPGVLSPTGKPWDPGMLVYVDDRELRVNEVLLVVSVVSKMDDRDLYTSMQCTLPEAYSAQPISGAELQNKLRKI